LAACKNGGQLQKNAANWKNGLFRPIAKMVALRPVAKNVSSFRAFRASSWPPHSGRHFGSLEKKNATEKSGL